MALLAGLTVWTIKIRKPKLNFPVACADGEVLSNLHGSHLKEAIAYVAEKHQCAIILNKKIVVSGIPDVTQEIVQAANRGLSAKPAVPKAAAIGVVDQQALAGSPSFAQARKKYNALFADLKLEFEKKSKTLPPEAKAELKAQYNQVLESYQQQLLDPVLKELEVKIKKLGKEERLACVVSKEDALYGGVSLNLDLPPHPPFPKAETPEHSIAIVNTKELFPLHPFFSRLGELDREEKSWKEGHYGIAETLLSQEELSRWEKNRREAMRLWEKDLRRLMSSVAGKTLPGGGSKSDAALNDKELESIRAALNEAYREELNQKMTELNRRYQNQVSSTQKEIEKTLKIFGENLLKFRNEKIAARRVELSADFEKKVKNRAAELEQEYLQFEKQLMAEGQSKKLNLELKLAVASPEERKVLEGQLNAVKNEEDRQKQAKQDELSRQLGSYRSQELEKIANQLKHEVAAVDEHAAEKIQKHRDGLVQASRESLKNQQENLKLELERFRGQALNKAKKTIGARFGKEPVEASLRQLGEQGKEGVQARLQSQRLKIQAKLEREEQEILANSKSYQGIMRSIKEGNRKIVTEVIAGLENEKVQILKAIREEIFKKAQMTAGKKGMSMILADVAVNINALDLTHAVAKELH